jgi:hypothetical protein
LYVPALPTAPSISSLSKNVRKVTINFTKSTFDAQSSGRLHYIEAQYYTGSAWTSWTVLGSVDSTVGTFTTADLLIAKSYRFRVRGYSDTGYGSYSSTSSEIFISAYGYRFESVNGTPTAKAIELAARYTGDVNDTIIVGGVTKTGWKQIQSVKRYTQSGYIDLIQ